MPYFQITEPFVAGNDFFEMVEHYMTLLKDIKSEICNNRNFRDLKLILCNNKDVASPEEMDKVKFGSVGFSYAKNLFYCALLSYYYKFHNFDEMAIKKLFVWAFMLRIDMENLGFDSVNKYAIGDENSRYTNTVGMFAKISLARMHHEISSLQIKVQWNPKSKWPKLYKAIEQISGRGGA